MECPVAQGGPSDGECLSMRGGYEEKPIRNHSECGAHAHERANACFAVASIIVASITATRPRCVHASASGHVHARVAGLCSGKTCPQTENDGQDKRQHLTRKLRVHDAFNMTGPTGGGKVFRIRRAPHHNWRYFCMRLLPKSATSTMPSAAIATAIG